MIKHKLFLIFSPRFHGWALKLIEQLGAQVSYAGLVTGARSNYRQIASHPLLGAARLRHLDELEREWLATPVSDDVKNQVRAIWSDGDLKRIIISDRNIGGSYVTGAILPKTTLRKLCRDSTYVERYVFNMCKWIADFFEGEAIDRVFSYAIAGAPAMAVFLYCRNRKIKFANLLPARIDHWYLMSSGPDYLEQETGDLHSLFLSKVDDGGPSTEYAKAYINRFRLAPVPPSYATKAAKQVRFESALRGILTGFVSNSYPIAIGRWRPISIRHPSAWTKLVYDVSVGFRRWRQLRIQSSYDLSAIHQRPYVYFPLHVDPEASTMVMAPMFTDQVAVVEALSKAIPIDMALVVKEHMPMLGKRPASFYARLRQLPNVVLLPPNVNGMAVLSGARLVAVLTGTAAWEAALLGKPALVMGTVPFSCVGGIVKCTDFTLLPEAISRAMQMKPAADADLIAYLSGLHSTCVDIDIWRTTPDSIGKKKSTQIAKNLAQRLVDKLDLA